MTESIVCCSKLPALTNAKSPFSKLIAFGYYDGPTSGVLQCDICTKAYKFEMLDWDEDQDVRIFSLSILPNLAFAKIVEVCQHCENPKWPVWVPIWQFPSEESQNKAEIEIEAILNTAMKPQIIVIAKNLTEEIIAARRMEENANKEVPDWFSLVGLSK